MAYRTDGSSALAPDYDDDFEAGENASSVDDSYRKEATGKIIDARDRFGGGNKNDKDDDWGNTLQGKVASRREAMEKLKESEKGATGKADDAKGGIAKAKSAEENGHKNNVAGKSAEQIVNKTVPGGKFLTKKLKKFGPMGSVLIVIIATIALFSGAQTMAPFGQIANGLDQFNALRTSMNRRTTYFKRFQLDNTRNKPVTAKATIFSKEKFKISHKMKKRMARNNIYYFGSADGHPKMLVYEDQETGKKYAIAANDSDVANLPDTVDIDGETVHITDKVKIDDALTGSKEFTRDFDISTRTVKGHIAGWFDSISQKLHTRIKNSRNRGKNNQETDTDEKIVDDIKAEERLKEDIDDTKVGSGDDDSEIQNERVPEYNDQGEESGERIRDIENGGDGLKKGMNGEEVKQSLTKRVSNQIAALGAKAGVICGALKAFGMINTLMSSIMTSNILNFVTTYFESVQKAQAGDGGVALHYFLNSLSQKGPTKDAYGNVIQGKEMTSSLESPAFNQFFSDGSVIVQADDPSAIKFNRDYAAKVAMSQKAVDTGVFSYSFGSWTSAVTGLGSTIAGYRACLGVDLASDVLALVDLAVDAALIIGAFFTAGISAAVAVIKNLVKEIAEAFIKQAVRLAITTLVMTVVQMMIPYIVQWLAKDFLTDMVGEDAAYAINSGINIYLGKQMQSSSGLPGSLTKVLAQQKITQEVIAEEAEFQRMTHSPFDITNKYTFLGSIVNSMIPVANSLGSPLKTVSGVVSNVGSAINSLLPVASAAGDEKLKTSINTNCPALKELEIDGEPLIGDAYCNPYFVSDYTTIDEDPMDVLKEVYEDDNDNFDTTGEDNVDTDDDGINDAYNPPIQEKSTLAKYIVACTTRDSQFGNADMNIAGYLSGSLADNMAMDTILNYGINLIPVVGDVYGAAQTGIEISNFGWTTGQNCVDPHYKYYSRYIEDQRMIESDGIVEKSAVTAFLDKFYEKYPLDDSPEGELARYSGMTVAQVQETLDYVAYFDFLAKYDASELGPNKAVKVENDYQYESEEVIAQVVPLSIVMREHDFGEVRNRSFAIV